MPGGVRNCLDRSYRARLAVWFSIVAETAWLIHFGCCGTDSWNRAGYVFALRGQLRLFRKVAAADSDRLVYTTIPEPDIREYQEQQNCFEGLSAFGSGSANFKAINTPSRRPVVFISANFLDVVHATPLMGRGFLPNEGRPGAEPVAMIGYDLWQEEFHGRSSAIGSVIRLDGQARTIVGIMPAGFKFPINDELWVPAEAGTAQMSGWGFVFGRLKPGISAGEARAQLNIIAARLAQQAGAGTNPPRGLPIMVDTLPASPI